MKRQQGGFTLVEIAIVLVIIGLLLGGILKGQELINSARVRNLADTNSGIQAAYYGFIDRYREVPGDWDPNDAGTAIGNTDVTLPAAGAATIGNGRVDNNLDEAGGVWEQLSMAGFIQGQYDPTSTPGSEAVYADFAPENPFNGALTLSRNADYAGTAATRLNLHFGTNIPVTISRELDVKLDDSRPETGDLRLSTVATGSPFTTLHAVSAAPVCTQSGATASDPLEYNITGDSQDCGVAFLY